MVEKLSFKQNWYMRENCQLDRYPLLRTILLLYELQGHKVSLVFCIAYFSEDETTRLRLQFKYTLSHIISEQWSLTH